MPDPIRRRGTTAHTAPRHSTRPQGKRQGGRQHTDGDAVIRRGVSNTTALHSSCHPPPQHTPHHPRRPHPPPLRGGGRRIPHHTNSTDIHSPPTHHTHDKEQYAHDSSTRQHCSGMSRARAVPPHWAGQQQHTPPPFHTPRRMDTIHSSTHLLSLIHVHTTNERS